MSGGLGARARRKERRKAEFDRLWPEAKRYFEDRYRKPLGPPHDREHYGFQIHVYRRAVLPFVAEERARLKAAGIEFTVPTQAEGTQQAGERPATRSAVRRTYEEEE